MSNRRSVVALLFVSFVLVSCSDGNEAADEPIKATTTTSSRSFFFESMPPTVEPEPVARLSTSRQFPSTAATSGPLVALSTTKVVIDAGNEQLVVDATDESTVPLEQPEWSSDAQSSAFAAGEGMGLLTGVVCPEARSTSHCRFEFWALDGQNLTWSSLGQAAPNELVPDWDAEVPAVLTASFNDGEFILELTDEAGEAATSTVAIDRTNGAVRRLDESPIYKEPGPPQSACTTSSGLEARLAEAENWALQVETNSNRWTTVADTAGSEILACGEDLAWVLSADRWIGVDASGAVAQAVELPTLDRGATRRTFVVGRGGRPALVVITALDDRYQVVVASALTEDAMVQDVPISPSGLGVGPCPVEWWK